MTLLEVSKRSYLSFFALDDSSIVISCRFFHGVRRVAVTRVAVKIMLVVSWDSCSLKPVCVEE